MARSEKSYRWGLVGSYLRLDPIEDAAFRPINSQPAAWNRVEVYYSRTTSGNAQDLAVVSSLRGTPRADFHFVIGNGKGIADGQIQFTESWKTQRTETGIIRVCVVADLYESPATDYQIRRTAALVDALSRFNIKTQYIRYQPIGRFKTDYNSSKAASYQPRLLLPVLLRLLEAVCPQANIRSTADPTQSFYSVFNYNPTQIMNHRIVHSLFYL